ncbi:type II toxin-antitoxin system Phd/YefM family antitoxin [Prosthecobacter sp.]|uniref:type II toxin-antitoxin system Phd/YefM family antitoxin n=1 Tax=Prosthecobacter sp. TaxID=1965333 RepID=UPI0037844E61
MKTMTVAAASRNFSSILNDVAASQEEVVIVRNRKPIVRLVPEPQAQNALEVFGDLYGTLDDETAEALADAVHFSKNAQAGPLNELRDPWDQK